MNEFKDYDALVDETTRWLFDGLIKGGGTELRSRVWGVMHARWRELEAAQETAKKLLKKDRKKKGKRHG